MRARLVNHEKHEKIAIAAFIITIAVSVLAFYYVYQQNVAYGRSVEGVMAYACTQYLKENPGETSCPKFTIVQQAQQYCVGQKETEQSNGCISKNSVCITMNAIMGNEAYKEYMLSKCPVGDANCACANYLQHFEAQSDITQTIFLAVDNKCPFIHKKDCP